MLAHSFTDSTLPLIVTWVTSELVTQAGSPPATSAPSETAFSQQQHNEAILADCQLDMNFILTYKTPRTQKHIRISDCG